MPTFDIRNSLTEYGADPSGLLRFDEDNPELLPYATLVAARRNNPEYLDSVVAVYENNNEPLAFLIDESTLTSDDHLNGIRRLLAMRGDAPYMGVVALDDFRVYSIALDDRSLREVQVEWGERARDPGACFTLLENERPDVATAHSGWISNVVLSLLEASMSTLIGLEVSHDDAISLIGRALFTRFLGDRNLLENDGGVAHLFDAPDKAKQTSEWLDEKFNGDMLPLSSDIFGLLPKEGYRELGNILRRAPGGEMYIGWEEKWDKLDFAHIPIGVLSQAYETYLRKHLPSQQRTQGGYFTPKPIAELMTQASFSPLRQRPDGAKNARVLDPAVGGGIFLQTAFRELVAEHWRVDGTRPNTDLLRKILYEQVVGFDINEAALRFAALGLYLLSIELDPEPLPLEKLKFKDLKGTVLHHLGSQEHKTLGSLGPHVGAEHDAKYDIVIGNPPWTSRTQLSGWSRVTELIEGIARDRGIANTKPPIPNKSLDLPFVWRAMKWAKPDGQVAFALHARLLFQKGYGMPKARQALFEALDITSVVNGSELRKTNVWPDVSAPFCLLFATNRKSSAEVGFRFVSSRIDQPLNDAGHMRIDVESAEVVSSWQLLENPPLLKILFRGSKLDLGILQRIHAAEHPTLRDFWKEKIGVVNQSKMLGSGNGYQKLRPKSSVRKHGDGQPGVDAAYLKGKREVNVGSMTTIQIDTSSLDFFSHERIHNRTSDSLFGGPQAIVKRSPSVGLERIDVGVTDEGLVFNETFYGYCPRGYMDAKLLVRYLALVLGSKLTLWMVLLTSGHFGFEREVIEKATLDDIPFPDLEELSTEQHGEINHLFEGLQSGDILWSQVDKWVVSLYDLGKRDMQVIQDTLRFNLPYARNKKYAQTAPSSTEKEQFCEIVADELRPWGDRFGSRLAVGLIPSPEWRPWHFIEIRTNNRNPTETLSLDEFAKFQRAEDSSNASEILIAKETDGLLIGKLAQKRYWSNSAARLLAQRIVWSHVDQFKQHADT